VADGATRNTTPKKSWKIPMVIKVIRSPRMISPPSGIDVAMTLGQP